MNIKTMIKGMSSIALAIAASVVSTTVIGASAYERDVPTQQEIKDRLEELNLDVHKPTEYITDYSSSEPYNIGEISEEDLQAALDSVNFVRFMAGLPDDVRLDSKYSVLCQSSSFINYTNGSLSHKPIKPEGVPDNIYSDGYLGSSSSNISYNYGSIAASVINGYIGDTDQNNLGALGHRRWVLNPPMKYTGFGITDKYTAMYALDNSRTESFTGDYVIWPPENMPNELVDRSNEYGYAYTVSLGDEYDTPDINKVKVQIKSSKLNKTWNLNSTSSNMKSNYLTVNTTNYGMQNCIIFNVGLFPENDTVTVSVNGITKNGVESPINYTVNYFDILDESYDVVGTEDITYEIEIGETIYIKGYNNPYNTYNYKWRYSSGLAACTDFDGKKSIKGDMVKLTGTHAGSGYIYVSDTSARARINVVEKKETHVHKYSPWEVVTPAAVNKIGTRTRMCAECGNVETRDIAPIAVLLDNCTISISEDNLICTGKEVEPIVTIKYNDIVLNEGSDYTVSYTDNVNPGQGKITITGKGSCYESYEQSFDITLDAPKLIDAKADTDSITVNWQSVAGADLYTVYRKTSTTDWTPITNTEKTSYTDKNIVKGVEYWYTARSAYKHNYYGDNYDPKGVSATVSKPNGAVKITGMIKDTDGVAGSDLITATFVSGDNTYKYALKDGSVIASEIPEGTYVLTVSSSKCVSRSQTVIVTANKTTEASITICLIGDVNNDGRLTTADVGLANSYVRKTKTPTEYQFACANINGDNKITTADVGRINSHVRKLKQLW